MTQLLKGNIEFLWLLFFWQLSNYYKKNLRLLTIKKDQQLQTLTRIFHFFFVSLEITNSKTLLVDVILNGLCTEIFVNVFSSLEVC